MPKPDTTFALAIVNSTELKAGAADLARLQASVVQQFKSISRMRNEEALRSLFAGLALHRIKASLPYGEFGRWTKKNLPMLGDRWVSYLMRLALVFLDTSRATKPMLLALPSGKTQLTPAKLEGAQRAFVEKAIKFIGRLNISELLDKHGIKETKKLGGARTKGASGPAAPLDAEALYLQARDEIGDVIARAETLFLTENRLQYLASHPDEVRGAVTALRDLADKVAAAAKPILKK